MLFPLPSTLFFQIFMWLTPSLPQSLPKCHLLRDTCLTTMHVRVHTHTHTQSYGEVFIVSQFIENEVEAQRSEGACPSPHSWIFNLAW